MSSSPDRVELAVRELVAALRESLSAEAAPRPDEPERLLSIEDAAKALGIGRTLAYGLIQSGQLRSIKVGARRRLVPTSAIAEYARGEVDEALTSIHRLAQTRLAKPR